MFKIGSNYINSHFFIRDYHNDSNKTGAIFLHCDGRVINVCEYFESKRAAQKVLDKYYPKPKHEWKHGDVFNNRFGVTMIYLTPLTGPEVRSVIDKCTGNCSVVRQLDRAKFLFNIEEKI